MERTASVPQATEQGESAGAKLRPDLKVIGVLGAAIATTAPSAGAAINPQGMAATGGRGAALAMLIACIGVACAGYGFARLSQHFNHSGSAYALAGATLGPRAGVMAGWLLWAVYLGYSLTGAILGGIFGTAFLNDIGFSISAESGPFIIALVMVAIGFTLAIFPVRTVGKVLLILEIATVTLIVALCVLIIIKVISGSAPGGQSFTLNMFTVPNGISSSDLFLAVTIGFLSFAGFEAAAAYGEEAKEPKKVIPRALVGVVLFLVAFFMLVVFSELLGFGTDAAGIESLVGSESTVGTLGQMYIGNWYGTILSLGVAVSAVSVGGAATVASARILFALSRDAFGHRAMGKVHGPTGVPRVASAVVLGVAMVVGFVTWAVWSPTPLDFFVWVATTATYGLLLVYLAVTVGAIRFLFLDKVKRVARWEIIVPIIGLFLVLYTLYRSLFPIPDGPPKYFPYVVIGWLAIAVIIVIAAPNYVRKVAARLDEAAAGQDHEPPLGVADVEV